MKKDNNTTKDKKEVFEGEPENTEQTASMDTNTDELTEDSTEGHPTTEELSPLEKAEKELALLQDKHLRLVAEYENYRKRTMKEKADLLLNGGERVLNDLLPVIDDIELALKNIQETSEIQALREGVELIYSKFGNYLQRNGVKEISPIGSPFNEEEQQAIAVIPAPTKEQKGIVIDCTKKGYTLNGKVLRFADVVVGE